MEQLSRKFCSSKGALEERMNRQSKQKTQRKVGDKVGLLLFCPLYYSALSKLIN